MRILLDECVTLDLKRELVGHTVETVRGLRWTHVKNGELLRLADEQFDVLLTVDQNLEYQQNLEGLRITLLVIITPDTRIKALRPLVPAILEALRSTQPGSVVHVG